MVDVVLKWIAENYPAIFIVLILIAAAVWITLKVNAFYHRFEKAEKECEKIENKIAPTLSALDKSIIALDKSAHALITFLTTKHPDLNPQ